MMMGHLFYRLYLWHERTHRQSREPSSTISREIQCGMHLAPRRTAAPRATARIFVATSVSVGAKTTSWSP
jgi:hypothetical protein